MSFAQRLVAVMKERGVSAYRLSKDTGLSDTQIAYYKAGKSDPTGGSLIKIADALDVSIDYLLGRVDINTVATLNANIAPTDEERQGDARSGVIINFKESVTMTSSERQGMNSEVDKKAAEVLECALEYVRRYPWEDVDMRPPTGLAHTFFVGTYRGPDIEPEELADETAALLLIERITGLSMSALKGIRDGGITLHQLERFKLIPDFEIPRGRELSSALLELDRFSSDEEVEKYRRFDEDRVMRKWWHYGEVDSLREDIAELKRGQEELKRGQEASKQDEVEFETRSSDLSASATEDSKNA